VIEAAPDHVVDLEVDPVSVASAVGRVRERVVVRVPGAVGQVRDVVDDDEEERLLAPGRVAQDPLRLARERRGAARERDALELGEQRPPDGVVEERRSGKNAAKPGGSVCEFGSSLA
jgi:hypothetical protein